MRVTARTLLVSLAFWFSVSSSAAEPPTITTTKLPSLPEPVSNNAVAVVRLDDNQYLVSALGLRKGKTWRDTTSKVLVHVVGDERWRVVDPVPGESGRLAGIAVPVNGAVYIFGGYTVAEDHTEVSVPTVHAWRPESAAFVEVTKMPVPVDDTVGLSYKDRYIYLVSGWHQTGNVNLVQVLDTKNNTWFQATPYPGDPVFGHAGGMVGNTMVLCDGVNIVVPKNPPRRFEASNQCFLGKVDDEDPARIEWRALERHPGESRYRMAATGVDRASGWVIFAGGSHNPYNYNGMGYNGSPSKPTSTVFAFSIAKNEWRLLGHLDTRTMDHRGLLAVDDGFVIVGGIHANQTVSAEVLRFDLPDSALD